MTSREHESDRRALCRRCNESMARGSRNGGERAFRCECGAGDCVSPINLTLVEYESVRAYSTRFAIAHNHENPETECVIAESTRFAVVEAVSPDEVKRARKTDPRNYTTALRPR